jgi:hypothetical protein
MADYYYVSMAICKKCNERKSGCGIPCIRSVCVHCETEKSEPIPNVDDFKKNLKHQLKKTPPPCIEQCNITPNWVIIDYDKLPQEFLDSHIVNKYMSDPKENIIKTPPNRFSDIDVV